MKDWRHESVLGVFGEGTSHYRTAANLPENRAGVGLPKIRESWIMATGGLELDRLTLYEKTVLAGGMGRSIGPVGQHLGR